ncbi:HAMP domain-containing sensor histidine kinase [Geomicrobium sp. JCM 19039]|uniref:sensor histidine kinase n=1 Tax=Geomicrobium sp. JCM 19039 TaxID=1460636 RepID=UPI00045F273D|nr:sensor histidine kinase [Geomicrobium sp. JCM 19039]GAK10812.1 two-component sensor histidine kinase BceS [Geomicrobium sp. JCM 19039]
MFIHYLLYKKSWIGLLGFLLILTNTLILLDMGIRVEPNSLLYLNVLFLTVCFVFIFWRYKKETAYYKLLSSLATDLGENWFERIPYPDSRFPDGIVNKLIEKIHEQNQTLRHREKSNNLLEYNDLASWIHEMKTPLTAMKITIDAHRSNELAQRLSSSWLKMHLLLDQQLYISRLATLESDLLPEELDVNLVIKEEIRELSTWCMEKNLAIDVSRSDAATSYTDRKWCAFVMRQLLTNAIKYSPDNGTIVITTEVDQKNAVTVTFKDEGPGIQGHDLPRIFDRGFTGDNGRVQHASTGMGLYLANEISNKLHIQLNVRSIVGQGSSFSMIFKPGNSFEQTRRTLLQPK